MKIEYKLSAEREQLIEYYLLQGLFLVGDIIEGIKDKKMFLLFSDTPNPESLEVSELQLLQQKISEQDAVIEELMFVIIPEMMGGGL